MINAQRKLELDEKYLEAWHVLSWMKEQGRFTGQVKAVATEYASETEEEKQFIRQHISGEE